MPTTPGHLCLMHTLKGTGRLGTALALPRAQLLLPATLTVDAEVDWAASDLGSISEVTTSIIARLNQCTAQANRDLTRSSAAYAEVTGQLNRAASNALEQREMLTCSLCQYSLDSIALTLSKCASVRRHRPRTAAQPLH